MKNDAYRKQLFSCIVFTLFFTGYSVSQTITGTVVGIEKELISPATVLIKESSDRDEVKEYVISRNGSFSITLKEAYTEIIIEVIANGYQSAFDSIKNPQKGNTYALHFLLDKKKITDLDEVVVVAKKSPFTIKKDTVVYAVSRYMDGTERKIEDVIKKLPGVEVNESTGEIKYRGKSIEAVLLDGDNLFGYNYSIGTKNINVDMVAEVEAIENFSENPLLKGIEGKENVALNLKLKKGKIDLSGGLDADTGLFDDIEEAFNLNGTLLGIGKKYKSFAVLAYNNIGLNQSPFDYFSFNAGVEALKEKEYLAEKIIPELQFSNALDNSRANNNKQFFGNYNSIFKISKRLTARINLYYIQDKIKNIQSYESQYTIDRDQFFTTDNIFAQKEPKQYRGDLKLSYKASSNSLLEYDMKLRQEAIYTINSISSNNDNDFESSLRSKDSYLKQELRYTHKLSTKNVWQSVMLHSFNGIPQNFNITPSVQITETNAIEIQETNFKKNYLKIENTLLGVTKEDKYSLSLGAIMENDRLHTTSFENGSLDIVEYSNNIGYNRKAIYQLGGYDWHFLKWKISPGYSLRILHQELKDNSLENESQKTDFIFEPSVNVKYKINQHSSFNLNVGYNQNSDAEKHLFLNEVLLDNRSTVSHIPSLYLQKVRLAGISYVNNNLKKLFHAFGGITYSKSEGNFFSNINVTETSTQTVYFYNKRGRESINANARLSKYIPFLESTVKVTSNYSFSKYQNIVNGSDWRKNDSHFFTNEFFIKTAFDFPVNFENIFTWSQTLSMGQDMFLFKNNALNNTFNVIVKPTKRWYAFFSSDYFIPDTSNSDENYFFLDVSLKYTPKNKSLNFGLAAKNLLNESTFEKITTTDIATNTYKIGLLPRHFLCKMSVTF